MNDFQAKNFWQRTVYSRPVIILLVILIVILARPVWKIWSKSRVVAEEQSQVVTQLAELQSRRDFLLQEIAALQTARGVEGEIRKKFPVVKEGEKVIIVSEEAITPATSTATTTGWWAQTKGLWPF
jgi:cell division protein FtsB